MQNLSPQDLQVLTDQVNNLDLVIQKLKKLVNSQLDFISLEFAGISNPDKKLAHWKVSLSKEITGFPALRAQEFLQAYCADLLVFRNSIIHLLENGSQPFEEKSEYTDCFSCGCKTEKFNWIRLRKNAPGTQPESIKVQLTGTAMLCSGCNCIM